jgi:MarR family transcriptional regulator, temperature-dependent positive regulator of motility
VTTDTLREPVDFELGDMVGYLIRVSQQVHYSLWQSGDVNGLTSPQFAVLHVLAHEDPLDQTTLGERASLDRTTVASIVTRLVRRGYLARERDQVDARRNLVTLTEVGRAAHEVALRGAYEINERLLLAISDEDRQALVRILSKVIANHRDDIQLD